MAAMTAIRRAAVACRVSRRLLSHSRASPTLLGHFYHPMCPQDPQAFQLPPAAAPAFQPLTASSPRLSLDFLPDIFDYTLYDSHRGLLLLRRKPQFDTRGFLVCDPVSRRHAPLPPPPISFRNGGEVVGAALLSRAAPADPEGGLRFELLCVALDVDRPRAWVASFRDGWCRWTALPRSRGVTVDFDAMRFERMSVHAAGGMYWHILNSPAVLALDAATMEFSFLWAPEFMWGGLDGPHKYRIGEMPEDGRLCVASLEEHGLQLCVRGHGDNGWVLERRIAMEEVLDSVPYLPKNPVVRHFRLWLGDVDRGRTGRVFINTIGFGNFSYDMNTKKLEYLAAEEDGMTFGHPVFAYFSTPDDGIGMGSA
ncbi:hypothetical protein CFC21_072395 [Triticum aestivum]|uniref:Uncharacterized protein n=3 Tax=Triticum TaxID=4564 RepID=A0A9R1ANA8_TRITD|nr:uncharacterized protein LOC123116487 [Triticum aestivum]KAF7066402.1 hypothetical protein CFC21_072395 [Triticum aestivum]VAI34185.1 unnamed protein product [Triticum turgidum subsp. durum]